MAPVQMARKLLGAWYTPPELCEILVEGVLRDFTPPANRPVRVLDPACGDGRILLEVARRLDLDGVAVELVGCDVDREALDAVDSRVQTVHADALTHDWCDERFDLVVGNPPFLSQMAASTTRRGSSPHGGGPYADAAVEFLSLAVRLARPDGGRVALVLPQSVLGARDAAPVRREVARAADLAWSWWAPRQSHFDAAVNVCVVGLQRPATRPTAPDVWTRIVTDRLGVPAIDDASLSIDGALGERAALNANFRDEYYALVGAVSDDADGPPFVTSGLIDPGCCRWGSKPVTFAKRSFERPRVDLSKLTGRFTRWADRKLAPKVLVANQTRVLEAVADPTGSWLPGVPVITVTPDEPARTAEIAAVLTSPVASALAWRTAAGTGLSTGTIRVGPALLAQLAWPGGDLRPATDALAAGDVVGCGRAVTAAYGLDPDRERPLLDWWTAQLPPDICERSPGPK